MACAYWKVGLLVLLLGCADAPQGQNEASELWDGDANSVLLEEGMVGTWDGVSFTFAEAEATVALANEASSGYLDDDLGLDARAVNSILDARPLTSVHRLSELYYVGNLALTILRDASLQDGTECLVRGWDSEVIDAHSEWRDVLPFGLLAMVEDVLTHDSWCGAASGLPWFARATIERFDCVDQSYTVELGQVMLGYPDSTWNIQFEVEEDLDWLNSGCMVASPF